MAFHNRFPTPGKKSYFMFEFFASVEALLHLIIELGRMSGRRLVQPLLTAACLACAYTAVHVGQEGSFVAGLRTAFLDSETVRFERRRSEDETTLQMELHHFAAANKLINQLMESLLARAPGASRIRLSVIHNGVTGLTGTGLLRYDDTNSIAAPGRVAGPEVTNQPLSDWSDFLPTLLSGECSFHRSADLHGISLRARYEAIGVTSLLVCPAADVQGKTVGAVFLLWDGNDSAPTGDAMKALMAAGQHQGAQIAAILDLRGPSPMALPIGGD